MSGRAPVRVGIDRALAPWAPEVRYVLRTLLRTAGLPYELRWTGAGDGGLDVYYGPRESAPRGAVVIPAGMRAFSAAGAVEPQKLLERDGLAFPLFAGESPAPPSEDGSLVFPVDIVFAAYWLLTGARERGYRRDRWDNLHLDGAALVALGLPARPLVSQWAERLRGHFERRGHEPVPRPWASNGRRAAFAFTHDVDYPEIIRPIEALRLLASRGAAGVRPALDVIGGRSHFWTFAEWVELERSLGARPTFYFMARRGSLARYALGTPDAFYDIRAPRFRRLFAELRDAGCEIGLHASYHAHRDASALRAERELVEEVSGAQVEGNRHHYWHLDPDAPHETLRRHEEAGLRYDSSLGLEMHPGFRRGICHPFRPYHPEERRELDVVQVPPAWMDDHFDRRLAHNGIEDPDVHARGLLDAARGTGGVVVVDYHARGMNEAIYPRYGAWLRAFVERELDASTGCMTPGEIARGYREYERCVERWSRDSTSQDRIVVGESRRAPAVELGPMRPSEAGAVARMHHGFFAAGERNGHSIAKLGPEFLEQVFYRLNLDNPFFFVDVARVDGEVVAFSAYASDRRAAFRHVVRQHAGALVLAALRLAVRRPVALVSHVAGNFGLLSDDVPPRIREVRGWWLLLAVLADYRTREFRERTGHRLADELWSYMEATLRAHSCDAVWAAPFQHNEPINRLFVNHGAELVAQARVQGMPSNYYVKPITMPQGVS